MGIIKNLVNAKVSGNVGSMNFRKRGSQTVVAERSYSNSSKGNGASLPQRAHRSRLANIVNFYRIIAAIEARAWQVKPENNSDFNMFSKYNLAASPIMLTKQEAVANACVIAPYEVSRGGLLPLQQSFADSKFVCGVLVGEGLNLANNTLGTISQAILDNNADWKNGDKLSVALLTHSYRELSGVTFPKVDVTYVEITLDVASEINFLQVPSVAAATPSVDTDGNLCFGLTCNAAFAIHSRKLSGILETSSQFIIMANTADPIFVKYSGDAQKEAAMASYGYQADVLLTPDDVAAIQPETITLANVTSVKYDGADLVSGSTIEGGSALVISGTDLTTKNVSVTLNGVKFVPQVTSSTSMQFTPSGAGALVISVNGVALYSVTCTAAPSSITSFKIGTMTYNTPMSNRRMYTNSSQSFDVYGTNLGELSATGCSLVDVGGDATHRTATIKTGTSEVPYTISCGSVVLYSGTLYDASGETQL